ncbi:hypothetical protein HOD88_02975 [archaeon]|nr:hypothetical protein [archaeon]
MNRSQWRVLAITFALIGILSIITATDSKSLCDSSQEYPLSNSNIWGCSRYNVFSAFAYFSFFLAIACSICFNLEKR